MKHYQKNVIGTDDWIVLERVAQCKSCRLSWSSHFAVTQLDPCSRNAMISKSTGVKINTYYHPDSVLQVDDHGCRDCSEALLSDALLRR